MLSVAFRFMLPNALVLLSIWIVWCDSIPYIIRCVFHCIFLQFLSFCPFLHLFHSIFFSLRIYACMVCASLHELYTRYDCIERAFLMSFRAAPSHTKIITYTAIFVRERQSNVPWLFLSLSLSVNLFPFRSVSSVSISGVQIENVDLEMASKQWRKAPTFICICKLLRIHKYDYVPMKFPVMQFTRVNVSIENS